jgi:general stress protein 26
MAGPASRCCAGLASIARLVMDLPTREFVLNIIDNATDLTLATVRPDGYPQATTVSYAHDGLTLYVGVGKDGQKADNIRRCNKVSLTINAAYPDWNHIKGLSMAGIASILVDPEKIRRAGACLQQRFPQLAGIEPAPGMDDIVFLEIEPQVISVLDYQQGFGHTELVTV